MIVYATDTIVDPNESKVSFNFNIQRSSTSFISNQHSKYNARIKRILCHKAIPNKPISTTIRLESSKDLIGQFYFNKLYNRAGNTTPDLIVHKFRYSVKFINFRKLFNGFRTGYPYIHLDIQIDDGGNKMSRFIVTLPPRSHIFCDDKYFWSSIRFHPDDIDDIDQEDLFNIENKTKGYGFLNDEYIPVTVVSDYIPESLQYVEDSDPPGRLYFRFYVESDRTVSLTGENKIDFRDKSSVIEEQQIQIRDLCKLLGLYGKRISLILRGFVIRLKIGKLKTSLWTISIELDPEVLAIFARSFEINLIDINLAFDIDKKFHLDTDNLELVSSTTQEIEQDVFRGQYPIIIESLNTTRPYLHIKKNVRGYLVGFLKGYDQCDSYTFPIGMEDGTFIVRFHNKHLNLIMFKERTILTLTLELHEIL